MTRPPESVLSVFPRAGRSAPAAASASADVRLSGVDKSFGPHVVLRNVHLHVDRGEFVALVGRSGCGKSTLLRIIAGLEPPTGGAVLVSGEPLKGVNPHARMMFQDARLLPWLKIDENVAVGNRGRVDATVTEALRLVKLEGRRGEWPAVLSGGQRQRVALARALVSDPPLLLLDEPLGALDALTRIEMQNLIHELWQARRSTAILVTHDIEEAILLADRVVSLEDGRLGREFEVPLARPRDRTSSDFQALVRRVLDHVLEIHGDDAADPPG